MGQGESPHHPQGGWHFLWKEQGRRVLGLCLPQHPRVPEWLSAGCITGFCITVLRRRLATGSPHWRSYCLPPQTGATLWLSESQAAGRSGHRVTSTPSPMQTWALLGTPQGWLGRKWLTRVFTEHFQAAEGCSQPQSLHPTGSGTHSLICEAAAKHLLSTQHQSRLLTRTLTCTLWAPGLLSTPNVDLHSQQIPSLLALGAYSMCRKKLKWPVG